MNAAWFPFYMNPARFPCNPSPFGPPAPAPPPSAPWHPAPLALYSDFREEQRPCRESLSDPHRAASRPPFRRGYRPCCSCLRACCCP